MVGQEQSFAEETRLVIGDRDTGSGDGRDTGDHADTTATETTTATSTSTPAVTPLTEITPIIIPAPLSPAPSPVDTMITDNEVQSFILEHYRATERKDLDPFSCSMMSGSITIPRGGAIRPLFEWLCQLFQALADRSFSVGDVRVIHSATANTVSVHF